MSMSKIIDIPLETTARYQPLSDLNVRFWNQDKNTAELRFLITRNDYPLSLSKENVKVIIALESGANFISSEDIIIDSEIEGVARYVIPNDFMKVANNVTGQVYVTTLDNDEVVVERQFSFQVSNDLLSDFPSEEKLRYIKTFDDLREEVANRITKLEEDLSNMEDYVSKVEQATKDGITSLTNLIKQKQDAYNANHTAKMKELNDKGTEYSTKFDEDKQYIDEKSQAFKDAVNGSGVVTEGQSKNWQKHKLTEDDGIRKYLNTKGFIHLDDLTPGYYEVITGTDAGAQGMPTGTPSTNSSIFEVDVWFSTSGRKQFRARQNYNNRVWEKTIHTNSVDTGWKEIAFINSDNPFETVQESQNKANTAESNSKTYTDDLYNSRNITLFEGSANGVNTVLNLSETLDNFIVLYVYGSYPGGTFVDLMDPTNTNDLIIDKVNVIGVGGEEATAFECMISKTSRTKLTITGDTYHGIKSGNGSGKDANRFTITKIIGVRK